MNTLKNIKLSNGEVLEVPQIDVNKQNAYGLLLAGQVKLATMLKKRESKRTEMENICIDFVNSLIFHCKVVLDLGVMPEAKFFSIGGEAKMKVLKKVA